MRAHLPSAALRLPGRGQMSWGLADQGFSSATNFGLTLLVGRLAGPDALGVVFLGFSVYLIVLTMQRALITEPLVVSCARMPVEQQAAATRSAVTAVGVSSATMTAVMLAAALASSGALRTGLLLFAPWLAGSMLQDLWRTVLFRDGRGAAATANDGLWALVMAAALPVAIVTSKEWAMVLTWGAGALAGGLLGFAQTRVRPCGLRPSLQWWQLHGWPLGRWLALEAALVIVQGQSVVFIAAALLGAADLGGLRAVEAVFAPTTLLVQAVGFPGLPILSRLSASSLVAARGWAVRLSGICVGLVLVYLVALGLARSHLLAAVFGASFGRFTDLVLPVGARQLIVAMSMGFALLLKADRRGVSLLTSRAVAATSTTLLAAVMAMQHSLVGVAWGLTAAVALGTGVTVLLALRDTDLRPAIPGARAQVAR